MPIKASRLGIATLAGTMVVAGPTIAACDIGPSYDEWAATDGAAGRSNMEDVQNAFKTSKSASEFEKKINRIYEGDGLVLIRSKQDGESLVLEGYEDLNKNFEIEDTQDDLLFSIVKAHENHELRGHGANSYYRHGFGTGDFLLTYLMISSLTPRGYYYSTPSSYARSTVSRDRTRFRNSSVYRSQVSRNSKYFSTQKRFGGSKYSSAGKNLGAGRQSYMARQKSTGTFKSSSTGVRSRWGSTNRSSYSRGGRGGFRGGGGSSTVIGYHRT